ncbi:MAG: hypothetical protein ABII18_12100 [bacterium]
MTNPIDTTYTPTVDHAAAAPEAAEPKKAGERVREELSELEIAPPQSTGALTLASDIVTITNSQSNGFILPLSLTLEGESYFPFVRSTGSPALDKKLGLWWKPAGTGQLLLHKDPVTKETSVIGPYTKGDFTNTLALGIPWSQANMIFSVAPLGWTTSYDLNSDYVTCATEGEDCNGEEQYVWKNGWTVGGSANWYLGGIQNPVLSNLSASYYYTFPEFEKELRETNPTMEKHKVGIKGLFPIKDGEFYAHFSAGLEVGIHEQGNREDNSHSITPAGGFTARLWGPEAGKAGGAFRLDLSGKIDPTSNTDSLGASEMHANEFAANFYLGIDTRKKDGHPPMGLAASYFNIMNLVVNPYFKVKSGSYLQDACLYKNDAGDQEIRDACESETWDTSRLTMPGTLGIASTQYTWGTKVRYGIPLTPAAWATSDNKAKRDLSGLQAEVTAEFSHTETHLEGEGVAVNQELPGQENKAAVGLGLRLEF